MVDKKSLALNDRAMRLLKALIDRYIVDGHPVGSKTLARDTDMDISSATIRNVMTELEKKGLVSSPHVSAGRIPTEQGFRLFVDAMLEIHPPQEAVIQMLKDELNPDHDTEYLLNTATALLSEITHMAGIITIPKRSQTSLRQIEFLPLPDRKVLAILVINEKDVQNRILHVDREYSPVELQQAANFLNERFAGQDIYDLRQSLVKEMQQARENLDEMMKMAVDMAGQALDDSLGGDDFKVQGKTNLIRYNNLDDRVQLKQIFETFDHKRDMLSLLDRCIQADGVKIFIGHEVGLEGFGECSLITAPYQLEGTSLGVLGIIGPKRMNYDQVIPVVDITAKMLNNALNQ